MQNDPQQNEPQFQQKIPQESSQEILQQSLSVSSEETAETKKPMEPSTQPFPPLAVEKEKKKIPFSEGKKELFRREEVRTMKKDLNKLLEEEARKEKERISKLKTEEEIKKEQERIARLKKEEEERIFSVKEEKLREHALWRAEEQKKEALRQAQEQILLQQQTAPPQPPPPPPKIPHPPPSIPLPQKPSLIDKLFSRTLIIGLMIAFWGILITFWYWYFAVRPKSKVTLPPPAPPAQQEQKVPETPQEQQPSSPPSPETEAPAQEQEPTQEQKPTPQIPQSIFPIDRDIALEFSSEEELPSLLSKTLQQYGGEDVFNRLVIRNSQTNTFVSLPEFLRILQIQAPEGFVDYLSPDATIFIYSSLTANRFGFITEITKDKHELEKIVQNWEPTMEKDTEKLFALLGKRGTTGITKFRQAFYKNVRFRYVSFPSINFGIVWSIFSFADPNTKTENQYFIFTSSGESIMRLIDRLSKTGGTLESL